MAQRILMKETEFNRAIVQELFSLPSTNRQHLELARQTLRDIIANEITARQRQMLLMRYYDQKRPCEIAAELDVNPSTVTRTLQRAEERIRKNMRFYLDFRHVLLQPEDEA